MTMKIAILEDNDDRQAIMRDLLADRFFMYPVHIFDAAAAMVDFLVGHLAETLVISLDHDLELKPGPHGRCLDPGTGREVADYLAKQLPVCPVIIHTTNSQAALSM